MTCPGTGSDRNFHHHSLTIFADRLIAAVCATQCRWQRHTGSNISQLARAASTTVGTFSLDLNSPNELGLLLNFLNRTALGGSCLHRPFVAAGKDATIERDQIARVPGPVSWMPTTERLPDPRLNITRRSSEINKVDINRLNNTVKLDGTDRHAFQHHIGTCR